MGYERTEEIRQKQREKMLQKTKEYNWDSIAEKRNKTIKENNIKVGRPKGAGKKTGRHKKCKCCTNTFYVTPSRENNKHYCSRECMYSDEDYHEKLKNVDRFYMKTEKYSNATSDPNLPAYKKYAYKVRKFSEETYLKYKETINPNDYPRTLCGVENGWQLDHVKSIKQCYNENISAEEASSLDNLKMVTWKENLEKRTYEKINDGNNF
jgi:hypothetical protein